MSAKKKMVKVSKDTFIGFHSIKASRLKRKVLNFLSDLTDNRDKNDNHSKIADNIKNRIREHIEMFSAREIHYSRSKN